MSHENIRAARFKFSLSGVKGVEYFGTRLQS